MSAPLVIAVDGPAASGKTTLATRLARHFDLPFLDTGLLYRAAAWRLLSSGLAGDDEAALVRAAQAVRLRDLERPELLAEATGALASRIAAHPAVREALLPLQRAFAANPKGAVLAGRDVGTVVFPDALAKIFVTASLEERARRRLCQLRRRGETPIYARVLEELRERDRRDRERAVAPLRAAPDALLLDTTSLDEAQAFDRARRFVEQRRQSVGEGRWTASPPRPDRQP